MDTFLKVKRAIIKQLQNTPAPCGDLSDIGNEIGFVIAKYFDKENTKKEFLDGLNHGISLIDGTHDSKT